MASENAKAVAKDVIEKLDKGEKVVFSEIMGNRGYAEASIKNPKNVTESDSYKEVMEPFAKRLEKEISRIQTAMEKKDLDKEQYRTLSDSLDKLNKNLQLVTGGVTETIGVRPVLVQFLNGKETDNNRDS